MARHSDPHATKVIDLLNEHINGSYNDNRVRDLYTGLNTPIPLFWGTTYYIYIIHILYVIGSEVHH